MKPATIYVPQTKALTRGQATWGRTPVDLAAVLAALTPEERTAIVVKEGTHGGSSDGEIALAAASSYSWISADSAETADVVTAIRGAIAERAAEVAMAEAREAREATERAERETADRAHAAEWAALPLEHRIEGERIATCRPSGSAEDYVGPLSASGYTRYHEQDLRRYAKEAVAEVESEASSRKAARLDREAADKKAKAAAEEASRQAWIGWAREHGSEDLRLAIADGYPLGDRVEREVVAALTPAVEGVEIDREIGTSADTGDRKVPSAKARAALASVKAAVEANPVEPPAGATVAVGRIRSLKWFEQCRHGGCEDCDSDGEHPVKRTGIPVVVSGDHYTETTWYVIG